MKLEAHNLVKTYRGRSVVNGASFYVAQGEIVLVNDRYGIRLTRVVPASERLDNL